MDSRLLAFSLTAFGFIMKSFDTDRHVGSKASPQGKASLLNLTPSMTIKGGPKNWTIFER